MTFRVTRGCVGCGACVATCPEAAFRFDTAVMPPLVVLDDRCTDCGECAEVCPVDACRPAGPDGAPGARRWVVA